MNAARSEVDMTHGPLAGKIVWFALPMAASSILQQLFNSADLAVVGRFTNAQAMAAVGSNGSVISLLVSLFVGMSVGANVVIAKLVGSGRRDRISSAVHTAIALAFLSGIFLTVVGVAIARPILTLMGAPQDVMQLAVLYLRIYFLGMPAMMTYNFGSAVLRSRGDSRRPFLSLTTAGIVNVLLNLLFVVVFHLHVVGVALATVLSNYLSAGLTLYFLANEEGEFRLRLRGLRLDREHLAGIVRIGVPAGVQGMVFAVSNVVIQSAVNSFGAACIAGMTASQNCDFLSYCLLNAFAQACTTFTSQNYGAGDAGRCRRVWGLSMGIGLGMDIVLLACILLARGQLVRIFTKDPEVIAYAMVRFSVCVQFHFLCGTYEITAGALRGMNRSLIPALISMLGTCAFRLLYVSVYFPAHRSLETLLAVYPISWVITGIVMNLACVLCSRKAYASMKPVTLNPSAREG